LWIEVYRKVVDKGQERFGAKEIIGMIVGLVIKSFSRKIVDQS
jgi:hypothetical protein